ncbi:phosphoglycolate phosphatase [Sphingomonas naasensis]|uniref:phosphoglycolate phosphatase n=1 Tax=Sphingomonas naasensis TaxID=1344951 RepID=A0A4S1WSX3_9SPHN|nr:HAD-IA family hydrolase [Sphingomonas naasensis]NIJ19350.1 phosphoglycolate phosphatase [Sphingomonas naasensis]TGX46519.1 HAD family hydrolase [Sphingomonas naasensis]
MTDFPFNIVGFDLDGTLFDTSADLTAALNHALALLGRPPLDVETVKPMIGRGGKYMLQQGLEASGGCDPDTLERTYPALLAFYGDNLTRGTHAFPGLAAAMDALDARGAKLAIVTNKSEQLAVQLVAELGLDHRFACVIGGDTMGPDGRKPSPAGIHEMIRRCGGGRAAFVGDSIFDTQAAKNAGIPSIAVSFGFLMQPIEELQADAVIDHYDELVPTLEKLGTA